MEGLHPSLIAIESIHRLFVRIGLPYNLAGSALLGIVREGKPLGQDDDIDVMTDFASWGQVAYLRESLIGDGWQFVLSMKDAQGEGLKLEFKREGAKLDLYFRYGLDPGRKWYAEYVRVAPRRFMVGVFSDPIGPLERAECGGVTFSRPKAIREYLRWHYGPEWHIPNPRWDFFNDSPNKLYQYNPSEEAKGGRVPAKRPSDPTE